MLKHAVLEQQRARFAHGIRGAGPTPPRPQVERRAERRKPRGKSHDDNLWQGRHVWTFHVQGPRHVCPK
jgi:hypothetical protein